MPPSSGSVSTQILAVLQRMESRLSTGGRNSGGTGGVTAAVIAGNIATQVLHSAVNAAPVSGGTLAAQAGLAMQAIGSDPTMVRHVMTAAYYVNQLRNNWENAGRAAKDYSIATLETAAGAAAITRIPGVMAGFRAMPALLQGGSLYGAGLASEAALGRNAASSSLRVVGAAQMGMEADRYLTARAATSGTRAAGLVAGAGRLGIAGLIASEVYNALPRGEAGTETRDQVRARGGNWEDYQALHQANTGNVLTNLASRGGFDWLGGQRGGALGGYENYERAAQRAGIISARPQGIMGHISNLYNLMRPHSVEETDRILEANQNPTDAGLRAAQAKRAMGTQSRRRDELTLALGFQSRQMDIGDLHGQVQQEAVKTETQQQSMNYLAQELHNAVEELQRLRQSADAPSSH